MVSDRTLISMPLNGLAALTNHSISFSCCSFVSVEGWNSFSTHFLASSIPASAGARGGATPRGRGRGGAAPPVLDSALFTPPSLMGRPWDGRPLPLAQRDASPYTRSALAP